MLAQAATLPGWLSPAALALLLRRPRSQQWLRGGNKTNWTSAQRQFALDELDKLKQAANQLATPEPPPILLSRLPLGLWCTSCGLPATQKLGTAADLPLIVART